MLEFIRFIACFSALSLAAAFAQLQAPATSVSAPAGDLPAQPLGPDDLLSLSVYGSPELTRNFRVGHDGGLRLPMLKQRLEVRGMLPNQLETAIAAELQTEKIMVDPIVTVSVAEYGSHPVTVMGSVRHPLTFQAFGTVSVLDALARAEGLTPEAGSEILLTRTKPGQEPEVTHIPVAKLIDRADPALNYRLTGGEQISVPESGRVYVMGNVRHPGSFPLKDGGDTTVFKVLAQAEGLTPYAQHEAFIYRRDPVSGKKSEIPIPIDKIMERKSPDVGLFANDILYVPDAKARRLTMGTLEKMAGLGASTASGMLIWHR